MKSLFGWAFDMWNDLRFAVGEAIDNALDVWNVSDDEEDQW